MAKSDRRRFIKTVLLATGATLLSRRDVLALGTRRATPVERGMQRFGVGHAYLKDGAAIAPPTTTSNVDIVIVGGGTAGLAAAWRLAKDKRDVLLLENELHVGGTMLAPSPEWRGISFPLGSTYFARYDGVYREFLDDIGVRPIETGEDAMWLGDKGAFADWWNPVNIKTLPIPEKDREAFRLFRDFILAVPPPTYPLDRVSAGTLAEYDPQSAVKFMERFRSPVLTRAMDLFSRSVLGAGLADVNAYAFLNFYSVEFGDAFNIPCYTFAGGLGVIAQSVEKYIGQQRIRTDAVVVNMKNTPAGVAVTYIDRQTGLVHQVNARAAIVATSKQIARRMIPDLPADQAKAIGALTYAPYITVALCCAAPLFPVRAFDFWVHDAKGRFIDIIDVTSSEDALKHATRTGPFVYMLSSPRPVGSFAGMDEAAFDRFLASFAQDMAQAVEDNIPGSLHKIEELHVYGWGHSMVIPTVGSYKALAPIISRPHGNIHFAHSDNDIAPGWENAVWHGAEAARRVME